MKIAESLFGKSFEEEGFLEAFAADVALNKDFLETFGVETCIEHDRRCGHGGRGEILHLVHIEAFEDRVL